MTTSFPHSTQYLDQQKKPKMNIVNFADYKKNKQNLMNRAINTELQQSVAALVLQSALNKNGFQKALVYHQDHNFAVILNISKFDLLLIRVSLFMRGQKTLKQTFRKMLFAEDPKIKEIIILNVWPSVKVATKIMKRWGVTSQNS